MVATRSKTRAPSATIKPASDIPAPARRAGPNPTRNTIRRWSHIPSRLTVTWLTISLPLVAWDTGYVLGRPHTMIGGKWHDPIWTPYGLYSNVDLVYGLKALDENNGFTAAQSTMNIIESGMYILYLLIIGLSARRDAKGRRALRGRNAGFAMLLGFGASLMTLSKTLLYALNEHYSGYRHTQHNTLEDLIWYYVVPNGAWIVFSTIMTWKFGAEIVDGIDVASR